MKKTLLLIAFLLFLSFGLLSKYEDRPFMRNLDFAVTVKVQDRIDRTAHLRLATIVGNMMEGATFFASPEFTVIVTLLVTAAFSYDRTNKRWKKRALLIPLALAAIVAIEIIGKTVVHHPSPSFGMIKHPTSIFPSNYINEQFSYPSGHSARAIYLAFLLYSFFLMNNLLKSKGVRIGLLCGLVAYVALVSTSRIYLGHHWFSDVIGGLLVGGSMGVGVHAMMGTGTYHAREI